MRRAFRQQLSDAIARVAVLYNVSTSELFKVNRDTSFWPNLHAINCWF